MQQVWIAMVEISVEPGDIDSGRTLAFTNFVTWGSSADEALRRITESVADYKWHILGCERIEPVDDALKYSNEISDLVDRVRGNPEFVLFGTFHTYPVQ